MSKADDRSTEDDNQGQAGAGRGEDPLHSQSLAPALGFVGFAGGTAFTPG